MKKIKAYKATHPDHTPNHGEHPPFVVGETYSIPDSSTPELCVRGYHASENISDVFRYYRAGSPVFEVEVFGDLDLGVDKICGRSVTILRELSENEIKELRAADGNQGNHNRGNHNRGDGNQGNLNRGNLNRGNGNRGNGNQGDYNQGNHNRGDYNRGDYNRGDYNRGHDNQGNHNRGHDNQGSNNLGDYNRGDYNRGDYNRGNHNRGDLNRGNHSWGIGCTGPTMIPCFDGALYVKSDSIPNAVQELALHPEDDRYFQSVLDLGAKPRKLAAWRKRFIELGE